MRIEDLTDEQFKVLGELDISVESLVKIPGKCLHDYMVYNDGYVVPGLDLLVFFDKFNGGTWLDQQKFIYYMGAERSMELIIKWAGITAFEISERILSRYMPNDVDEGTDE